MKKLVTVTEPRTEIVEEDAYLMSLMGQRVTFWCMNYIWTGKLIGVNNVNVLLEDAHLVFETGAFNTKDWKDAQKLPGEMAIQLSAVEAFGVVK